MTDLEEHEAYTWLCGRLPQLRRRAAEDGWKDRLDRIVTAVTQGGSAVEACHKLSYSGPAADMRGVLPGPISIAGLRIDPVPVRGEYACPHDRCSRVGAPGTDGREPRCSLFGEVMRLRPAGENAP